MNTVECPTTPKAAGPASRGIGLNLPNQITVLRLLLAIIFFVLLGRFDARAPQYWTLDVAYILFIVAGLTDILDGYLARKHNQITSLGRVLDPFVDKILVIGAYAFMAGENFINDQGVKTTGVAIWMVVVILGRELLVTSLRGVSEASGKSFAANVYGKLKMFLQSVTAVWILVAVAHPVQPDTGPFYRFLVSCKPVLIYLTVFATFLSMIPYLWSARGILSQTSASPK
jgi:CDP-diacylglycerol--glycerol-3-phosphate 3-phosphatidyltransferase